MDNISKTENKELMTQARESLSGFWGLAVGAILINFLIFAVIGLIPVLGGIVIFLIAGALTLGLCIFALAISRKQDPKFSLIFQGFKKFGVSLGAYLLQFIFVLLWSLLLIVPGIIAALSYTLTFYIIADNDKIGPLEAIKKSKELMYGNKWKLCCLIGRFIGWMIIGMLTLGIAYLWITPYILVSYAKFYDDIKNSIEEPQKI